SFLVDTTGDPSFLAVTVTAKGFYAENLRMEFASESLETISKRRLQACVQKYFEARRVGQLQYRDDREANEFVVAELFEINSFLLGDENSDVCWLQIQSSALIGMLPAPPLAPRRTPLALPYPCKVVHVVEVEAMGLSVAVLPAAKMRNEFFEFSSTSRGVRKFVSATFTLTMLTDAVAPQRLAEYKKQVERVVPMFSVQLPLPLGHPRPRKRGDFGTLPPPRSNATAPLSP